jgi:hypothetical protein
MKGTKIDFSKVDGGLASVQFDQTVEGLEMTAQNGIINLGTERGTDPLYPTRGTDLFSAAVVGSLIDKSERAHATALAAEQTRLFLRAEQDLQDLEQDSDARILKVGLEVRSIELKKIVFNAFFVNVNDQTLGLSLTEPL